MRLAVIADIHGNVAALEAVYAEPTPPSPHVSETGSPHARYALLAQGAGRWRVDLVAVAYDWDRASACAAENGRPDWARALATGYVD